MVIVLDNSQLLLWSLPLVVLALLFYLAHIIIRNPTSSSQMVLVAEPTVPPHQSKVQDKSGDIDVLSYLFYRALGSRDPKDIKTVSVEKPSPPNTLPSPKRANRRSKRSTSPKKKQLNRVNQPFDALLVFDVEATCVEGRDFNWCNEIIEWPVVLLKWFDKTPDGKAAQLVRVDEFRSYIRPTYRPTLTDFCKSLTGISQMDVDHAPTFTEMLPDFKAWLVKHGLISAKTEQPLQRFLWCTDGPFDIRDFVVKQCFISKVKMPLWLRTDIMDVRRVVSNWILNREIDIARQQGSSSGPASPPQFRTSHKLPAHFKRPSLNIGSQLQALSLPPFEGRQHSGIDDSRNIARIVTELGRLGVRLESNLNIDPGRKWYWMGAQPGEICEDHL